PPSPRKRRGAAWPPGLAATTSTVLPGCEPIRLLGEGTFGTVVLVRERSTGQLFAAKAMSKLQLIEAQQLASIVTERQVLREAGPHPFVVQCHSGFQTPDAVVLVLEYVSGGDMYDLLKMHGCLTEEQMRFYLAEIVIAVAELHRHDFVFRDLKLENILIDEHGHVRLTDFGLAGKFVSGEPGEQAIFDISGTAIYQAPEMLADKGHGRVVDWWALGVLAYVLLAGRPPFAANESREQLHHRILNEELDLDNDDKLVSTSDACKDFIRRLLDKDPATRLGSARSDAVDVKKHPFFDGIDWGGVENLDLPPPLSPAKAPPLLNGAPTNPQEVKEARERLADKMCKPSLGGLRRKKSSKKALDAGEYKPVQVLGSSSERVSIGLDFGGTNKLQSGKTWTGTADDYGREIVR
ncbi:Serine/threonine protein kinase, partial [Chondrus crispus]